MGSILKNGLIALRALNHQDRLLLSELANNKHIWDNLRDYMPYPYSIIDAGNFINLTSQEKPQLNFGIEYENNFCGVIGINPQKDVYRKSAEVGYWIGEPYWNKGIATIALALITDYALNTLNYNRLHTGVFENNTASMKVLEKNGYLKEGIFKKAVIKNGTMLDEHRYAILKSDS